MQVHICTYLHMYTVCSYYIHITGLDYILYDSVVREKLLWNLFNTELKGTIFFFHFVNQFCIKNVYNTIFFYLFTVAFDNYLHFNDIFSPFIIILNFATVIIFCV